MKTLVIAAAAIAICGGAAPSLARKAPTPKISMAAAKSIALKRAPGRVQDAEYEYEKGGWRYSFDIRQGRRIHEIGVDGMTGRIVEDTFEAPGAKD